MIIPGHSLISLVVRFDILLVLLRRLIEVGLGSNPGCDTNGFSAAKGWDPATGEFFALRFGRCELILLFVGLGSPNYTALHTAAGL